jgi:signal transduction histidine kinase
MAGRGRALPSATMRNLIRTAAAAVAFLVTGLVAGVLGFAWSAVSSLLVLLLSVTHLGGPVFLGATWVARQLAGVDRRRAGWVLGARIASPYVPVSGDTVRRRVTAVAAQPATWRDLAWLVLDFPLGVAGGIAGTVIAAVDLGAITAPAWAWVVPNPHAPFPMHFLMTTTPGRFVLSGLGLLLFPLAVLLVRLFAKSLARLAAALLGPGEHRRLVEQTEHLVRSRQRVVDAQAAELRRIERDLHDGAQARIVAAGMTLALASRKLRTSTSDDAGADVELARRQLDDALAELRRLVRGIHPPILTDRGLHAALAALAGDAPFEVELRGDPDVRYPAAVESAAYFVVAEGLTNAAKHARASTGIVDVSRCPGSVRITVTDDGCGGADPAGSGIDGLRRRVEALDGILTLTSPPGGPTVLHAELPCAS